MMAFDINASWYFILSTALFGIGLYGVLTQKSAIRLLMCVEMLLNAANINFVAFSSLYGTSTGYSYALFVIAIAAAEAAVGLAIFVNLWRVRKTIELDQVRSLRW
ncbi:MAG TPA: NADH-quinone oxidoreductase subunit NuoK [Candidatus Thermoplasmatota archaeon]|nr:NADH-quinone oxidoreductase subunit NuoK [Candidatus Thermoplasmatota archaeon]